MKAPADQFYYGDWLRDVELQSASACSRGVWINMLARMWFANPRGELHGTREGLAKLSISTLDEFDTFWKEAQALGFCYTSQNSNGILTVRNRRMFREEKAREANRLRQQRHYDKRKSNTESNGELTPPSSSPSPSAKKKDMQVSPALLFPLKDGTDYPLELMKISQYEKTYGSKIDVMFELKECLQWNIDRPKQRKTKTGILGHINFWLNRAVKDKGPGIHPGIEHDGTAVEEMNQELEKITPELRAKNREWIKGLAKGVTKKI